MEFNNDVLSSKKFKLLNELVNFAFYHAIPCLVFYYKNVKLNMIYLNTYKPYLIRCFFITVIIVNLDFRDMFDLWPIFSCSPSAPFPQTWTITDLQILKFL